MGVVNARNKTILNSATLIHGVYRSLLNTGRTYAAFRPEQLKPLIERFKDHKEIFDPMAGYGCLMTYCSQSVYGKKTFNLECNPPSYYWQVLIHPENIARFIQLSKSMLSKKKKWPRLKLDACASNDWFPESSLHLLGKLWAVCLESTKLIFEDPSKMTLAFLLPFVGRLGSFVQGNVVTHIKQGGICIYSGWDDDFEKYINALINRLSDNLAKCKQGKHTLVLGDARTYKLGNKKFTAMVTSPPYPNGRDYSKMFAIENAFINWSVSKNYIEDVSLKTRLIGSPIVSESEGYRKKTPDDVKSTKAKEFLKFISEFNKTERAINDNRVYYVPYYSDYFYGLEKAFENISQYLNDEFEGYIVVVNNTARKKVIPVAEAVMEMWNNLNFNAEIDGIKELSHVGGINPRVKGLNARHVEYTIKIFR